MRARLVRSSPRGPHRAAPVMGVNVLGVTGLAVTVPAALMIAGCGSSHPSSGGALKPEGTFDTGGAVPTATAVAPSAQPTDELYKTVLKRYREYHAVYKRIYEKNDPAELSDVAVDPLLSEVTKDVEATKAKGVIWRFANTVNPRVYGHSTDGTKVYVIDCVRTLGGYRYSAKTGERLGGGPGGAYVFRTTVQYASGAWKVANAVQDRPC